MKHPVNREWTEAFLYYPMDNGKEYFVREKTEFKERFKLVHFGDYERKDGKWVKND